MDPSIHRRLAMMIVNEGDFKRKSDFVCTQRFMLIFNITYSSRKGNYILYLHRMLQSSVQLPISGPSRLKANSGS